MEVVNKPNYMTIKQLVTFILFYLILSVFLSFIIVPISMIFGDVVAIDFSKMLNAPIFILIILWVRNYRKKQFAINDIPPPKLNFRGVKMYYVLIGIIIICAFNIVLEPLDKLIPESDLLRYYKVFENGNVALSIFSGVLMAPILEEILFRGYIQQDLSIRYGKFYSVIISALVFGLIHFSFVQSFSAFISGLVIGLIFYVSKNSIITVILIHLLNNFVSLLFLKVDRGDDNLLTITDMIHNPEIVISIQIISYVVVILFIYWLFYCRYKWSKQSV